MITAYATLKKAAATANQRKAPTLKRKGEK
jgi:hypothetical protein